MVQMTLGVEDRSRHVQQRRGIHSPSVEQLVAGTISCDLTAECRWHHIVTADTLWKLLASMPCRQR